MAHGNPDGRLPEAVSVLTIGTHEFAFLNDGSLARGRACPFAGIVFIAEPGTVTTDRVGLGISRKTTTVTRCTWHDGRRNHTLTIGLRLMRFQTVPEGGEPDGHSQNPSNRSTRGDHYELQSEYSKSVLITQAKAKRSSSQTRLRTRAARQNAAESTSRC
jgi:hypothetical protein